MDTELSWQKYIDPSFSLTDFPAGSKVLDVGCGNGRYLRELATKGCTAVGVEPDAECVNALRGEGFDVRQGYAESLPFDAATFDGIVCNVVIPYTNERRAIGEWARVLTPNGEVSAVYHGAGYFLRYVAAGASWKFRLYGVRSIANSIYYAATGRRIKGWIGDTLYQSDRRLRMYYDQFGLKCVTAQNSKGYLGLPVFICHRLIKK